MRRAICVFVFSLVFVLGSSAAQAATDPPIAGPASGIELCPQFICHIAIFAGVFHGQIGNNFNAFALVTTSLNHGDLPTVIGKSTPIYNGGSWEMQSLLGQFQGEVTGGQIVYSGHNRFHVTILITVTSGGAGTLTLDGTLDHNPLIPTFGGIFH